MTTQEKINYLINIGIPIKTIAKYSGYNETHISKYSKGVINISPRCAAAIENGLAQLIKDMEMIYNDR